MQVLVVGGMCSVKAASWQPASFIFMKYLLKSQKVSITMG